jgi:hypothetical protein
MATFRKRNSLWQAQVRSRKHGSISKSFHLKSDAQAWAREQESLMQTGQWSTDHNKATTLGDLLCTYKELVTVASPSGHKKPIPNDITPLQRIGVKMSYCHSL